MTESRLVCKYFWAPNPVLCLLYWSFTGKKILASSLRFASYANILSKTVPFPFGERSYKRS